MREVKKPKINPIEIGAFFIYVLLWIIAAFELVNMQSLRLDHGNVVSYFPVLLFIASIFYAIYLAAYSFWRKGNQIFYRWLLGCAILPLLIMVIIVIGELQ